MGTLATTPFTDTLNTIISIYWPDPYSPELLGTNENTNSLIRGYFPKNQSLSLQTVEEVKRCQWKLKHRPKRAPGYRTPAKILFDKVLHLV